MRTRTPTPGHSAPAGSLRRSMRRLQVLAGLVAGTVAVSGVAWAYWSSAGTGTAAATVATLNAPTGVTATSPPATSTVHVSWTGSALSSGPAAQGYHVTRVRTSDGTSAPACGTSAAAPTTAASCDDLAVTDGTYRYTVTALFASWSATSTPSASVTVVSDSTPPTVSSLVRADASPTNAGTVRWTVTFSEPVTGVDASDFALVRSGVTGGSVTGVTGSGTTYTVTAGTGTGTGTLRLDLVDDDSVTDAAGNALGGTGTGNGNAAGQPYTIDRTPPTVTVNQKVGQADPTNTLLLRFTVTFSEPVTGFDASDLTRTGTATGGVVSVTGSGADYEISVTGALTDGTVSFSVSAGTVQDAAGNTNTASTSTDNTITYDTVAPSAPSAPSLTAASDSGASSSDRVTNVTTPTFTGTAEAGATVTLYDGASAVGTSVATGGSYAITSSVLTNGSHTLTAKATDPAGNTGSASAGTTVTIDTTAPVVTITSLTSGGGNSKVNVTGTASSTDGNVTLYLCHSTPCSSGNAVYVTTNLTAVNGTWFDGTGNIGGGVYYATAIQTDVAGNAGAGTAGPFTR